MFQVLGHELQAKTEPRRAAGEVGFPFPGSASLFSPSLCSSGRWPSIVFPPSSRLSHHPSPFRSESQETGHGRLMALGPLSRQLCPSRLGCGQIVPSENAVPGPRALRIRAREKWHSKCHPGQGRASLPEVLTCRQLQLRDGDSLDHISQIRRLKLEQRALSNLSRISQSVTDKPSRSSSLSCLS